MDILILSTWNLSAKSIIQVIAVDTCDTVKYSWTFTRVTIWMAVVTKSVQIVICYTISTCKFWSAMITWWNTLKALLVGIFIIKLWTSVNTESVSWVEFKKRVGRLARQAVCRGRSTLQTEWSTYDANF